MREGRDEWRPWSPGERDEGGLAYMSVGFVCYCGLCVCVCLRDLADRGRRNGGEVEEAG